MQCSAMRSSVNGEIPFLGDEFATQRPPLVYKSGGPLSCPPHGGFLYLVDSQRAALSLWSPRSGYSQSDTRMWATSRGEKYLCQPALDGGRLAWDQDCIVRAITGLPLHEKGRGHYLGVVLGMREAFIRALCAGELKQGRAWVIIGCARKRDREYFRTALQAEVVMLLPSIEVCLERARERSCDMTAAIRKWFLEYEP